MLSCKFCSGPLDFFGDFGMMPIANSFSEYPKTDEQFRFSLKTALCRDCKLVQIGEQPAPEMMFHADYAFYSSTSLHMTQHFLNLANKLFDSRILTPGMKVVEIGCNDGIFLSHLQDRGLQVVGVEPSSNVASIAESRGLHVERNYFSHDFGEALCDRIGRVDLIFAANVICHIGDINSVFAGFVALMSDTGLVVFEDPYILDVIEKNSFDQFYDEHAFLFGVHSVKNVATRHGLELVNVERIGTHGGSMRYFLAKKGAQAVSTKVAAFLMLERSLGLTELDVYMKFFERVTCNRAQTIDFLTTIKEHGGRVCGYGATSKSTTMLNYFDIGCEFIDCIFDTTPTKIGKFSPGVGIPVRDYKEFRSEQLDFVFLLAWNHKREIIDKELEFTRSRPIKWITYIPTISLF
jgi:methylation protein EvaC